MIANDFLNTGAFGVGIVGLLLISRALSDGQRKVLENWQQVQADCRAAMAELTKRHEEEFRQLIDDHRRLQDKQLQVLTDVTRAIEGSKESLRALQDEIADLTRRLDDRDDRRPGRRTSPPAAPAQPAGPETHA